VLALAALSGGVAELLQAQNNVEGMLRLGYPLYFMKILGFWKVLGAIAILVPNFPRLKEWAYAGLFFNMTGAAASHVAAADYGRYAFHVLVPLFLALLVLASWVLRPQNRSLGILPLTETRAP